MKNLFAALTICTLASLTTGCLFSGDLDAVYVSGHLGNYMDCPQDGYTERAAESRRGAPANDADFAACEPAEDGDESNCGWGGPLNCEAAQLTIQITNTGTDSARGVSVDKIEIIGDNGWVVTTLPLLGAVDADTGEAFSGRVAPGQSVTLRVDYQGPRDISEFVPSQNSWGGSAVLRVTVGADNRLDVVIDTKAVEVLPAIVT